MENPLYNKKHFREYLLYGLVAAVCYMIPTVIFFADMDYNRMWILYLGTGLFMFAIMIYAWQLSKRRPEYKSSWMMILASHFALITGVIISVVFTCICCFIFIPGFFSGNSTEVLTDAPTALNKNNTDLILTLFLCAAGANYFAGSFIAVLGPYVFKNNQTKDKAAVLEDNIAFAKRPA